MLLNQPLWTRETVRSMLDEAADGRDPETVHIVQLWIDGMHSRIFYLIKASCGDLVCRGLDSYFEGVFHEEELRRHALCNCLWTYVGD